VATALVSPTPQSHTSNRSWRLSFATFVVPSLPSRESFGSTTAATQKKSMYSLSSADRTNAAPGASPSLMAGAKLLKDWTRLDVMTNCSTIGRM
jgi:hypothetical protein